MRGAVLHVYNFRDLPHAGITVGRNCVIGMNAVIMGQGGVRIGDDVILGPGAMVLPIDHRHDDPGRPIREQGISGEGIEIGNGAWIGAGALVLDGVKVGANAVVAAGAVVTRDVPACTVAAGNPARVVKTAPEDMTV
jgi:acetyltransferase-like isoleucine patch superfamily enzyme